MSTYTDASFIISASGGYKEGDATPTAGKLYSLKPDGGVFPVFYINRDSTYERVDKNGDTDTVPVNTAIVDWTTGSPLLLVTQNCNIYKNDLSTNYKITLVTESTIEESWAIFTSFRLPQGLYHSVIFKEESAPTDLTYYLNEGIQEIGELQNSSLVITDGSDDFEIVSGILQFKVTPDYEVKNLYTLTLSDGVETFNITIHINDVTSETTLLLGTQLLTETIL